MKKTVVLMGSFLVGATALSVDLYALQDVPEIQYQIKTAIKNLIKQEGKIETTHEGVVDAQEAYEKTSNDSTYAALLTAVKRDSQAVADYNTMVSGYQTLVGSLPSAEQTFYEDTPATKTEIDTGPVGKDTPEGGESVSSEIPIPPPILLEQLQKEIKDNGGVSSSFAEQLKAQQQKLQSVQTRIENEMKTDAVKSNPDALKQDNDLVSALSKAINARRCALNPDECEDSSKAKK